MLEALDIQFKESIKYGMTYNQFWFDDPQLYYTYEEVYLDRLKEKDVLNWQLGQYITSAISVYLGKNCKYPEKPMFYAREKEKPLSMMDKFLLMVNQVNKNFN